MAAPGERGRRGGAVPGDAELLVPRDAQVARALSGGQHEAGRRVHGLLPTLGRGLEDEETQEEETIRPRPRTHTQCNTKPGL